MELTIGHFRYIKIQLDSEAERTQPKEMHKHFFYLCPLSLTVKLNLNMSKTVFWFILQNASSSYDSRGKYWVHEKSVKSTLASSVLFKLILPCKKRRNMIIESLRIDDFCTTPPLDCVTCSLRMPFWALVSFARKSTTLVRAICRRLGNRRTWG